MLAIALGIVFFVRPGAGLVAIALWGALVYGGLQLVVGIRLLRRPPPGGHAL